jgi:D-3-phosphoglycerate dehydrogenase
VEYLEVASMKVLVTDVVDDEALDVIRERHEVDVKKVTPDELLEVVPKYHALVVRSGTKVTKDVLDKGERLKVVSMAGIGVDNIDVAHATTKKIPVTNAPMGSTYSVADLAFGLLISLQRFIPRADRSMKGGLWEKVKLKGTELKDKTLGIIGIGRIGKQVSLRANAFGMRVIAYDPYVSEETMKEFGAERVEELGKLLAESDMVTVHAVLTHETRGMMNYERLKAMKGTAVLVNTARGKIVLEKDLAKALEEKLIAGAALDVYESEPPKDSPILKMDNVVITPHIGASTFEGQKRAGMIVAKDVVEILEGRKPENLVNPEIYG